jgi:uridylate kinase
MLGTLMNGIILAQTLQNLGCRSTLLSCIPVGEFIQTYSQEKAKRALQQGEIVIFVGGTGHPFFTTDTAASLRALEIEAEVLLKATKVDGVYSADPKKVASANRYDEITFTEALEKNLQVMDATAISLCRENNLPIVVFDMYQKNNLLKVIQKKNCGTLVHGN